MICGYWDVSLVAPGQKPREGKRGTRTDRAEGREAGGRAGGKGWGIHAYFERFIGVLDVCVVDNSIRPAFLFDLRQSLGL